MKPIEFDELKPLLVEAAELNSHMTVGGDAPWSDRDYVLYHDLVREIYAPLRALFDALVGAGVLGGIFYKHRAQGAEDASDFIFFQADDVEVGGCITLVGNDPIEATGTLAATLMNAGFSPNV